MSYIWQDFNIKTFPAETVVFRDGVFCRELSTLDSPIIEKNYDLPVHFIYVGELIGKNNLDIIINENVKNQKLFLSVKVKVHKLADFSVSVKNSGDGCDLHGFIVIENHGNINCNLDAYHLCKNTGILLKTRLLAYKNSTSVLSGTAHIYKYCDGVRSGIDFSALADNNAKIIFKPEQKISAIPENAYHCANIAKYTQPQIEYLYQSGLTDDKIQSVLKDAFITNTDY